MDEESKAYIKKHEGFRDKIYNDNGKKAIGYGFRIESNPGLPKDVRMGKRPITRQEADAYFEQIFPATRNRAMQFAGNKYSKLSPDQKMVLDDMSYNLTGKLMGFEDMQRNIMQENWKGASEEIKDSNYYTQVPNRAKENIAKFLTPQKLDRKP